MPGGSVPILPKGAPASGDATHAAVYLHAAGFTGADLLTAVAISGAESGWQVNRRGGPNTNGTYDWGLMQINDTNNPTAKEKTDGPANAKKAYSLYVKAGHSFAPWATFQSGKYRDYLGQAQAAINTASANGSAWQNNVASGNGMDGWTGPGGVNVPNPLDAISGGFSALTSQLSKMGGNVLSITVALVLLVVGVLLIKSGSIGKAAETVARLRP